MLPTQGLSTQATAPNNFIPWCKNFCEEYETKFGGASPVSAEEENKYHLRFKAFLDVSERKQQHNKMINNFCLESQNNDNGLLVSKFYSIFFTLMDKCEVDEVHRVYFLLPFLKIFDVEELEADIAVELESFYKTEVKKLTPVRIHELFTEAERMVKDGAILRYRSIQLFVWLASLPTNNLKMKTILGNLLADCPEKIVSAVVQIICDHDQLPLFRAYAESFLRTGFGRNNAHQKIGFSKITSFLSKLAENEIHDILIAFCNSWAVKESEFFMQLDGEIAEFCQVLHRHPLVGKAAIKFFKKHKKYVRTSIFALICQLALISSQRYQAEVSKMLSLSFSKIWQFADDLKTDAWIREKIMDLKLHEIRNKLNVILDFIKECPTAAKQLIPGLTTFSIQLIECGAKKANMNVINGRLEDSQNSVAFLGRSILVRTTTANYDLTEEPLKALVSAICSNASKVSTAYLLIDALIEIRKEFGGALVQKWEIFNKIAYNICEFPSDVGVKIMSALMPVIIKRAGLRKEIFHSLKHQMISLSKVSTALPVMFQLLRSLVEQPETKNAFQYSQSFATFSSQINSQTNGTDGKNVKDAIEIIECVKRCLHQSATSKCLVYTGIVELCKKNNFFIIQGLGLLLTELKALPELKFKNYIQRTGDEIKLKYPCPHLFKAISTILSAVLLNRENSSDEMSASQLQKNGLSISEDSVQVVDEYIETICEIDLEDIELDASNPHLSKSATSAKSSQQYKLFASMVIQLYDVIIEHLWVPGKALADSEGDIKKIGKLLSQRQKIVELLTELKAKNLKEANPDAPGFNVQDIQIDIPKLSDLLQSTTGPDFENIPSNLVENFKNNAVFWLIERIHDSASSLDAKSSTCLASKSSLTTMACNLLSFFYLSDTDTADTVIKAFVGAKTKALESYTKILLYILSKYEQGCAEPLETIYDQVIAVERENSAYVLTQDIPSQAAAADIAGRDVVFTQADNPNDAGHAQSFRISSMKHIMAIFEIFLPATFTLHELFESRKLLPEYPKQIYCLVSIARKLISMQVSSANVIKKKILKVMLSVAARYEMGDKSSTPEYWKAVLEVIVQSNCDGKWIKNFEKLIDSLHMISTEDEEDSGYRSLNHKVFPQFYCILTQALCELFAKVRKAIEMKLEIGDEIDDDFLHVVCSSTESFAELIKKILNVNADEVRKNEAMSASAVNMLTNFYATMNAITQRFKAHISSKTEMDEWNSMATYNGLICGITDDIVGSEAKLYIGYNIGSSKSTEDSSPPPAKKAKKSKSKKSEKERAEEEALRRNKKDENLFCKLDKEFEVFHCALIMIEQKYSNSDRSLTIPSADNRAVRGFRLNDSKAQDENEQTESGDEGSRDFLSESGDNEDVEMEDEEENEEEEEKESSDEASDDSD